MRLSAEQRKRVHTPVALGPARTPQIKHRNRGDTPMHLLALARHGIQNPATAEIIHSKNCSSQYAQGNHRIRGSTQGVTLHPAIQSKHQPHQRQYTEPTDIHCSQRRATPHSRHYTNEAAPRILTERETAATAEPRQKSHRIPTETQPHAQIDKGSIKEFALLQRTTVCQAGQRITHHSQVTHQSGLFETILPPSGHAPAPRSRKQAAKAQEETAKTDFGERTNR